MTATERPLGTFDHTYRGTRLGINRGRTTLRLSCLLALSVIANSWASAADDPASVIPLQSGLKLTSVLRSPAGERENLILVEQATPAGVTYSWRAVQYSKNGEREQETFSRFVRSADLETASRLHTVYWSFDRAAYPGYTAWSISSAIYRQLRDSGKADFMIVDKADASVPGLRNSLKLKGTLSATAKPEPFPLLINGQRVSVPAIHLHGDFALQEQRRSIELWVLSDAAHPLLLKSVNGEDVLQLVRADLPDRTLSVQPGSEGTDGPSRAGRGGDEKAVGVEVALDTDCRTELPGVYFEFATSELTPESDPTIASLAQLLQKHPDWRIAIEGHTDNIGADAANFELSQARAGAVRTRLVDQHGIAPGRLTSAGYGEARPRESNSTIEGRARNRRVEIVRSCTPPSPASANDRSVPLRR